jgi:hypothetical protein
MIVTKKKQQAPEAPKRKGAALANQANITENHRSQVAQHCQQTTATGTRVTGIGPPFFDHFFFSFEVFFLRVRLITLTYYLWFSVMFT